MISHEAFVERLLLLWGDSIPHQYRLFAIRHQLSNLLELLDNDVANLPSSPLLLDFIKRTIESIKVSVTKDECLKQLEGSLTKNTCLALSIFDLTSRSYKRSYLGALYLQVSQIFALLSVDPKEFESKSNKEQSELKTTIRNANYDIGLFLRESRNLITEAPKSSFTDFFDLLFKLKNYDPDMVKISDIYWNKLVKEGMRYLIGCVFSQPLPKPRQYSPRVSPVEPPADVHILVSIPLKGGDKDNPYHLLVEEQPLNPLDDEPLLSGRREINSRSSIESKEQSGVQLCPSRLSVLEKRTLIDWIRNSENDISKSLVLLTILTTLRPFEIFGVQIALNKDEVDIYKRQDDAYGVFDLFTGVYWRKEPPIEDAYIANEEDKKWLHEHSEWLPLVIPNELLIPLKMTFSCYGSGRILDILPYKNQEEFNSITLIARRKIREHGGLTRKITLRSLRYFLYGEVADEYGQHIASLMFANTEFMGPICHYYMALDVGVISDIYIKVVGRVGFSLMDFSSSIPNSYLGSQLAINSNVFAERLKIKIALLEGLLDGVKDCVDIESIRSAYNELCGYTLIMFFFCSSHRRLSSSFAELSMLTENFSHVLVADKLHSGESASRLLPLPSKLCSQLGSAISHIANIAKNAKLSPLIRNKLLSSISLNGKEPFLGFWNDDNELVPSSTAQIARFFGEDWKLPQNSLRQFSFQMLLAHKKGAQYLLRQMGHSTADTHPFSASSLMVFDGDEDSEHRDIFEELLNGLGFKVLRKARKSLALSDWEGSESNIRWPTNTIQARKQSTLRENLAIEKRVQEACQLCLEGSSQSVYEMLQEKFSETPDKYNYALKFLAKHIDDLDVKQPLTKDQIKELLDYKILTPQAENMVYPFDTPMSMRRYTQYEQALNLASVAALYAMEETAIEDIEMLLFCSLLLDSDIGFIKECNISSVEVVLKDIAYNKGVMISNVADQTIFIGGRSSIFLALLLAKFNKTDVRLNFLGFRSRLNYWLSLSKKDSHLPSHLSLLSKLAVVITKITASSKNPIKALIKVVKNAPRCGEMGVQYALRHEKIKSKPLTITKLARLMYPNSYFPLPAESMNKLTTKVISKVHFVSDNKGVTVSAFGNDFLSFLNDSKSGSFKAIESYWLKLLKCENEVKSFTNLVEMSSSLPEVGVFVLTWLYHWSRRRGRSGGKSGLKLSTIKSYFSRVGRPLINILGASSLQVLDSDELLDIYQQVIDSGNIDSREQRLSALQSFHKVCSDHFYMADIDWRDLDIELPTSQYAGNLITPIEFHLTQELIQNDPNMADDDKITCLSILILCYRMGLRRGEVRRLRAFDFCFEDGLCHVRSNHLGTVKTVSGNRRIPVDVLLCSDEYNLIKSLVAKAAENGSNTPLFFSQYRKDRIRPMDRLFSRVIEALRITTGDPKIRLHDCRHSAINFIFTALIISDAQQDPIAEAVKSYLPYGDIKDFKKKIRSALVASVSPDSSLLPAIAQMVGHSKASTTIAHYMHLTHYWLWLTLEKQTKATSFFDKAIAHITGIPITQLRVRKTRESCSAAQIAVSALLNEKFSLIVMCNGVSRPVQQLSDWRFENVFNQIEELSNIEKALRYLEFLSRGQQLSGIKVLDLKQLSELERFDLDSQRVNCISRAYQDVITEDLIIYRAFNILSRETVEVLPVDYRSKETKRYFKSEGFIRLLELLLIHQRQHSEDIDALLNIWETGWDASTHSFRVKASQTELLEKCLGNMGISVIYSNKATVRTFKTIQWSCRDVKSAMMKAGKVSLPQLSHILFLLTVQRKLLSLQG
ncbi:hypothetical protein MUS1_06250 [Marinomonas ushuaiensis DSM 15871]|uniref:Tyr recombinase domain-containing protein n=1 Tax=Marinomonas ushuaiensis DSM 15871 TaxID=1122207 RepID=X7E0V1_9GAMM|nr:site-specific integrase [Marinomonas ushuaiensis]ETX09709.1 hypothetical protein MUS1_06250 [Marinomonas ushuaiensis DSM 15871]